MTVLRLDDYRGGIRAEGLTLIYRGIRRKLSPAHALRLSECLQEARVMSGTWAAAGFSLNSDGRTVTISCWDMGPATLRGKAKLRMCLELARAGRRNLERGDAELKRTQENRQ